MDIERCASHRRGADPTVVVRNAVPVLRREPGRLVLRVAHNPSPDEGGTEYDYEVSLTDADLEWIRHFLANQPHEVAHGEKAGS